VENKGMLLQCRLYD